jgi:hypothetical protein
MRLQPHRRTLVVFSSSAAASGGRGAARYPRRARTGRVRRLIRIVVLSMVIAVRPRWRPLLAGTVLTAIGFIDRHGVVGMLVVPGVLSLWHALLIPGDPDADRERRSRLERELAAYSTPAERRDLEAILDRYPDGIAYELRDILASQAMASRNTGIPGARSY